MKIALKVSGTGQTYVYDSELDAFDFTDLDRPLKLTTYAPALEGAPPPLGISDTDTAIKPTEYIKDDAE